MLTRSLTHIPTDPLTGRLIDWLTDSLTHSLTHLLTHSINQPSNSHARAGTHTHTHTHWLSHSFAPTLTHSTNQPAKSPTLSPIHSYQLTHPPYTWQLLNLQAMSSNNVTTSTSAMSDITLLVSLSLSCQLFPERQPQWKDLMQLCLWQAQKGSHS